MSIVSIPDLQEQYNLILKKGNDFVTREEFLKERLKIGIDRIKSILHIFKKTYVQLAEEAGVPTSKVHAVFNTTRTYEISEWINIFRILNSYLQEGRQKGKLSDIDCDFLENSINQARQNIIFFDEPEKINAESINYINVNDNFDIFFNTLKSDKEILFKIVGLPNSGKTNMIYKSILKLAESDNNHIYINCKKIVDNSKTYEEFIYLFLIELKKSISLLDLFPIEDTFEKHKTKYKNFPDHNSIVIECLKNFLPHINNKTFIWFDNIDYLYTYSEESSTLISEFILIFYTVLRQLNIASKKLKIIYSYTYLLPERKTTDLKASSFLHSIIKESATGMPKHWFDNEIEVALGSTGLPFQEQMDIHENSEFNISQIDDYEIRNIRKKIVYKFNGVCSILNIIIYKLHTNQIDKNSLVKDMELKFLLDDVQIKEAVNDHKKECERLLEMYSLYSNKLGFRKLELYKKAVDELNKSKTFL